MSHILINTYNSNLLVNGQCILSEEGTLPLIDRLKGIANQTWYADDSVAASRLDQLRRWWDLLKKIGPHYGYFPNGAKHTS